MPTNCLSVFGHFVGLALKWLNVIQLNKNLNMLLICPHLLPLSTSVLILKGWTKDLLLLDTGIWQNANFLWVHANLINICKLVIQSFLLARVQQKYCGLPWDVVIDNWREFDLLMWFWMKVLCFLPPKTIKW